MKDIIKDTLIYGFLIGCAGFCLFILVVIALYGEYALYEPTKIILIGEIALCVGMLALGFERLRHFIITRRK